MIDLFGRDSEFAHERQAREEGFYPYFRPFDGSEGPEAVLEGRRVVMMGSNNYLGLTTHPRVKEAARKAVEEWGTSMTGSRLLNGSSRLHESLEERIADFLGKEAALVFTTGYQVNLSVISALLQDGDVALIDRGVHASIYDGIRLAAAGGAKLSRYRRNSAESLRNHLDRIDEAAGCLVLADGVYSSDGAVLDLPSLLPEIRGAGARLMIDDAHGIGALGPGGRGTAHHFGLSEQVDLIGGTFSKALASVGGFVAGPASVLEVVRQRASAFIFAASGAPSTLAAALAALDVMETESWRLERLADNATYLRAGLQQLGFDVGEGGSPIIPVPVGDPIAVGRMWRALVEDHGVYVNAFVPPAVGPGRSLLRLSVMATHQRAHLDRALDAVDVVGREFGSHG